MISVSQAFYFFFISLCPNLLHLFFEGIDCHSMFAQQAGTCSYLAQVCMCHLPSVYHLYRCPLPRPFLFPIKIPEHSIYLHHVHRDLMGAFQDNLILCGSPNGSALAAKFLGFSDMLIELCESEKPWHLS